MRFLYPSTTVWQRLSLSLIATEVRAVWRFKHATDIKLAQPSGSICIADDQLSPANPPPPLPPKKKKKKKKKKTTKKQTKKKTKKTKQTKQNKTKTKQKTTHTQKVAADFRKLKKKEKKRLHTSSRRNQRLP